MTQTKPFAAGRTILAFHEHIWENLEQDPANFASTAFIEGLSAAVTHPEWARWMFDRLVAEGMPCDPDLDWSTLLSREAIETLDGLMP